jgi:hypothetical protein
LDVKWVNAGKGHFVDSFVVGIHGVKIRKRKNKVTTSGTNYKYPVELGADLEFGPLVIIDIYFDLDAILLAIN